MKAKKETEEDSNMNGRGEVPRLTSKAKTGIAMFSILATIILIVSTFGMSGMVKAEKEVVSESGGMTAQLDLDISDLTYSTDEVLYKQTWDSIGEWSTTDISDSNISDSKLYLEGLDESYTKTSISGVSGMNGTDGTYVESRVKYDSTTMYSQVPELMDSNNDPFRLTTDNNAEFAVTYSNGTDETYSEVITSQEADKWYRLSVYVGTGGDVTAKVMHDNYSVINEVSVDNYTGDGSDLSTHTFKSKDSITTVDYYYVSTGESADSSTPTDIDDSDLKPESKYERKQDIDLSNADFINKTGDNDINEAIGLDDPAQFESQRYLEGMETINYTAVTPEDPQQKNEKNGMYIGWKDIKNSIKDKMIEHAAESENVEKPMIEIIDYRLNDVYVQNEFQMDYQEDVQEEWADVLLETAKNKGWKLNVTGVTDGYETVETILANTDLQMTERLGETEFGVDPLDNTKLSVGGATVGEDIEYSIYDGFERPGKVKRILMGESLAFLGIGEGVEDAIEKGNSWAIDFGKEVKNVKDTMQNMMGKMRDRTLGAFGFSDMTTGDIESALSNNIVSDSLGAAKEMPGKFIQMTNGAIGSTLETGTNQMSQFLKYTKDTMNGFALSMKKAGALMAKSGMLGASGLLAAGKAMPSPFSMMFGNNIQKIITYTVIIGIAVVIIAAIAYVWKSGPARRRRS